jgi:plastocyanin
MKPFVWIVIALVVLIGAYFLFASRSNDADDASDTPAPTTNETNTNETLINETPTADEPSEEGDVTSDETVVYTNSGFSPVNLTVKRGTTVIFRNDSSGQLWVASDPHPVHTDLSSFDSRQGIAPGESFRYTFNETGTWGYHNHLDSGDEGTVTVQ